VNGPERRIEVGDRRLDLSQFSQQYRIVGVASPHMRGSFGDDTALWIPYEPWQAAAYGDFGASDWLQGIARLRNAVSAETVPIVVAIRLACLLMLASLDSARQAGSTAPAELLRE